MGPSQFMPNTWMGYRDAVGRIVGATASPFEPQHAFVGTGLYLRDALDLCSTSFSETFKLRACTAAKYYAGLNTSGSRLLRHMNPTWSYGYKVASRAAKFEEDIRILDL